MESVLKNHVIPLFIIFVLTALIANVVIAKEYSLSEVEKAAYAGDLTTLNEAWQGAEGRVKTVAGYRWVTIKMFAVGDMEGGKDFLNEYVSWLEQDLARERKNGESWAILATMRGVQIAAAPEYASVFGPKMGLEMALATDYGKNHPVVFMLQGMNLYNTPEQYGGDKARALMLLNNSVELYTAADTEHWGLLDVYTWRGQAHLSQGDKEAARKDFEKALTYAPQSTWVQGLLASIK